MGQQSGRQAAQSSRRNLGLKPGDEVELSPLPSGAIGIGKVDPGAEFLARIAEFNVLAPEGYLSNRDEANER